MQQRISNLLVRALLAVLWTYAVIGGANRFGALDPRVSQMTLLLLAITVTLWLLVRHLQRWRWYRSPLDGVILLWLASFAVSFAANSELWRRMVMGIWHALVYIGIWYMLYDTLANRRLTRDSVIESLLIAGLVVMAFGLAELLSWAAGRLTDSASRLPPPRIASPLNNPIMVASFLTIVVTLAAGQALTARRRLAQVGMVLYALVGLLLLSLTLSRGGWLGMGAASVVLSLLWLLERNLLRGNRLISLWRRQRWISRLLVSAAALLFVTVGGYVIVSRTLSENVSGPEGRVELFSIAIRMFEEQPLTGHGLFTYGHGLLRLRSVPPEQVHNQAHNVVLNIAAEQGLIGLITLTLTLILCARAIMRNWRQVLWRERVLLASLIAALSGYAVHHLTDVSAIVPAIALAGIFTLVPAVIPETPAPSPMWQQRAFPFLLGGMWALVLIAGFWDRAPYQAYADALGHGLSTGDYASAARRMQTAIDADPALAAYHLKQAAFFGLAAFEGDLVAAQEGIDAYRRFCEQEAFYAPAWANLAALYWQVGDSEAAIQAMRHATDIAFAHWVPAFNLGVYYESVGEGEAARQSYEEALRRAPEASLYPAWAETPLRREIAEYPRELVPLAQAIMAMGEGRFDQAGVIIERLPTEQRESMVARLARVTLDLVEGDRVSGLDLLAEMRGSVRAPGDDPAIRLAAAAIARVQGAESFYRDELEAARSLLTQPTYFLRDDLATDTITYLQFLRMGTTQGHFLPHLFAPVYSPYHYVLLDIIERGAW